MRPLMSFLLLMLFLGASLSDAKFLGTQEIEFIIPGTDRKVVAEMYYLTTEKDVKSTKKVMHGIWQRKSYKKNAQLDPQQQPRPLVIFSHGWQGDRFGNSWVAESLVDEGYIVAMIDHTHNNSYEHSDAFVYTSLWQRPQDLSALLDHLLEHPVWAQEIDKNRIAVGGFSLGGLTALWIAGIEGSENDFKESMQNYARWSDWPQSVKKTAQEVDWKKATRSYHDPRVKAAFTIAPDLGKGFKPEGIQRAKIPVLLIVGNQDTVTPPSANACYYHSHIKNASLLKIKKAEHFSFMNACSPLGKRITPHLCKDSPSASRLKIHKQAAHKIRIFLKEKLGNLE